MRLRWLVIAMAAVLAVSACSGKSVKESSGGGGGATPTTSATSAKCTGVTLTSPDTGVDSKNITITVMADTGSPIRPGLFQGSVDAIKAFANYVNANGGLACRKVKVNVVDSKLTQTDAKNGAVQACGNSLAMVGTTALFFKDIDVLENCKDKNGKKTGLPDIAELQTESTQQCSPVSYAVLPGTGSCPYSGTGPRTFTVGLAQYDYLTKNFGPNLHGIWVVPTDLNSTIASSTPLIAATEEAGIKIDKEFGESGLATQTAYTPVAAAMKQYKATYARNGLDYKGTVLMRKEAQQQGVDTVKVWDCSVQCYDKRLISEGGAAVEGQWVWLNILPLEDKASNEQLQKMYEYEQKAGKTPDGFGEVAWLDGLLFQQAVQSIVDTQGPNAVTRANLLAAIKDIHDFTGGGLAPSIDVGNKKASPCVVGMQVKGKAFVRVDPPEPAKFDCDGNKTIKVTLDPLKSFQG